MTYQDSSQEVVEVKEKVTQDNVPGVDGVPVSSVDRHERVEVVRNQRGERHERVVEDFGAERKTIVAKFIRFIWFGTGILEFMILLRMLLKLIAANPNSAFTQLVYGFTDLFLWPFSGLIASPTAGNGMVLEISSFLALLVYAVLAWGVVQLIEIFATSAKSRSVSVYQVDKH
jgi:hypothetical protein